MILSRSSTSYIPYFSLIYAFNYHQASLPYNSIQIWYFQRLFCKINLKDTVEQTFQIIIILFMLTRHQIISIIMAHNLRENWLSEKSVDRCLSKKPNWQTFSTDFFSRIILEYFLHALMGCLAILLAYLLLIYYFVCVYVCDQNTNFHQLAIGITVFWEKRSGISIYYYNMMGK